MKLLLDHNVSPKLVRRPDLYPGSTHVFLEGMDRESDAAVWEYALGNSYVIVTKDADFADMSVLRGHPPKVIWVRIGNCSTQQIEDLFRGQQEMINEFETDQTIALLELI